MKEIVLTKGFVALVDDSDFNWLNQWKWTAAVRKNTCYAYRIVYINGKYSQQVYMHRLIMGANCKEQPDHVDGNGLNNQRYNLRLVTHQQNIWNRRDYGKAHPGTYKTPDGMWHAVITHNKQRIYLGTFNNQKEASAGYLNAVIKLRSEYTSGIKLNTNMPGRRIKNMKRKGEYTSVYRGVSRIRGNHWRAEIRIEGKCIFLGHYETEIEAADAYDAAAINHRGARALTNKTLELL